jgi:hypothetical protein
MIFDPIRVVSRPKKNGIGTHFGVHFPGGVVYDYTYEDGFRQTTLHHFSDGMPVTTVREISWHLAHIVRARLDEVSRNPRKYHLLEWNCETFAEWLTSGVAKSAQVAAAIVLVGAVVVLAFAARASG